METFTVHTENGKKVLTMAEYVTKEQVIDWYRPYGQTDEPIPFETLVSDLRDMKTADVAPVRHGEWIVCGDGDNVPWMCSHCGKTTAHKYKVMYGKYCPNCGARMDGDKNA